MNILDIIEKKRDAKELNKEEIEFFVKGYTDGSIPDYQAAALVMAIYINGMTKEETTNLALAALCGTLIIGTGLAIAFSINASTGGTDILAKILNKSYQLGVNQFLFNVTDDIKKALEISENMGCTWSVIGMTNFNTFNGDLNVFDNFNTTTVILDGSFVDKKIDEGDFEYIINYL